MDYEMVEDSETHAKHSEIELLTRVYGRGMFRIINSQVEVFRALFTVIFSVSLTVGAFTARASVPAGRWDFVFTVWFALLIILVVIAGVLFEIKRVKSRSVKDIAATASRKQIERTASYYVNYIFNYRIGKDLRLYGLAPMISKKISDANMESANIMRNVWKNNMKYDGIGIFISFVMSALTYGFITVKAIFGAFPVGNVVQYIGALTRFTESLRNLSFYGQGLLYDSIALKKYLDFLDIPEKMKNGTLRVENKNGGEHEIEFKNVSFKYKGGERYAIKNLNLKLRVGQRFAVVGLNGSGKTTMIKLLCRLYDPDEGEILLNGINIKEYIYDEYLEIFSVVFQDFKLFSFSLGQNVAASAFYDAERAADCLTKAGFGERLSEMPSGLDTPLYKDFDENGVEISGGEAQKIALARALYKNTPVVVLDEPTAALDPIAEYDIYSRFNEIIGGKTAIFISHRLSSCRFCGDIAVFHEGSLVQRGGHDELLADKNGKYGELWNAQARHYFE